MLYLHGLVRFSSSLDLRSVAELVSAHLFGGVPFIATNEFDEFPGVRLQCELLALSAAVYGTGLEYGLLLATEFHDHLKMSTPNYEIVNIHEYIEEPLLTLNEIQLIPS